MSKLSFTTAIVAGNHKLEPDFKITFDQKAYTLGLKLHEEISHSALIQLIDNKIAIKDLFSQVEKSLIRPVHNLIPILKAQIATSHFVVFESSVKQQAKNKKQLYCSLLGPNAYRSMEETKVCSCWGLGVIAVLQLFERFEKVVFVTAPDSEPLKQEDAIKMNLFFQTHDEYKERFELIWAK